VDAASNGPLPVVSGVGAGAGDGADIAGATGGARTHGWLAACGCSTCDG
jgi:hypothetical protein